MKKRFLPVPALAAVMAIFIPIAHAAFSDVSANHSNFDAISYVQEQKIVDGYKDGTYKPDNNINRAEFTKIIVNAVATADEIDSCITNASEKTSDTIFFPDVSKTEWFAKYVCEAKVKGIIKGYPDGSFKPANDINFVESAKIIAVGFNLQTGTDPVWYKPFVTALADLKAIPSTVTGFDKLITRGEMAEIIYRLKADITDKDSLTYDQIAGGTTVTRPTVNLNLMLFWGKQVENFATPSYPIYSRNCFTNGTDCKSYPLYGDEWTLNTSNRLAFDSARTRLIYPMAAGVFQLNIFDIKSLESAYLGLESKYNISYLPIAMDDTMAAAVISSDQKETVIKYDLATDKEVSVTGFDSYDKCTWPAVLADHNVIAVCNKGSAYSIVEEGGTELYSSSDEITSLAADRNGNMYFAENSLVRRMKVGDKEAVTLAIPADYKVVTITASPFGDHIAGKAQKDNDWVIFDYMQVEKSFTTLETYTLEPGIPAFGTLIFTDSNSK